MPLEDPLNGGRREVLAVDPEPVVVASGEIEEAGLVAIGQITRPVPALAQPGPLGVVVAPVALESRTAALRHQLADRLLRVEQAAAVVEACRRAFRAGLGIEHD